MHVVRLLAVLAPMVDAPMFADRERAGSANEIRHAPAEVKFAAQASACSGEVETGSPARTGARKGRILRRLEDVAARC
jgi:hypothetical protein